MPRVVDSLQEQVAVYRFQAGQGLEYLASRKIEYDLKVSGYKDVSEFSYDRMRELYQQEVSRQAAKAAAAVGVSKFTSRQARREE